MKDIKLFPIFKWEGKRKRKREKEKAKEAAMCWGWRRVVREIRKSNPAKIKDRHQGELTSHNKAEGWAKGGTKHWGERVSSEHQKQASRNWNRSSNHPLAHPLTFLSRPC